MTDLPDIHERFFIFKGNIAGCGRDFSKLFMKGKTGILILKPVEFLSKTAFAKKYPEHKGELRFLDPSRNVESHKQQKEEKKPKYCVYNDNDPLPRMPLKFDSLEEAIAHTVKHEDECPFSIRYPSGEWHKWKYQVFCDQGQGHGGHPEGEYDTLQEALGHVEVEKGSGSFGIKYPDGTWHNWDKDTNKRA